MRNLDKIGLCDAVVKKTGLPCWRPVAAGQERCRFHNGSMKTAEAGFRAVRERMREGTYVGTTASNQQCKHIAHGTGKRCQQFAIAGGDVCLFHGGGFPSTRMKARARLNALVDPALERINDLMHQDDDRSTALRAARDVLDRSDEFKPEPPAPPPAVMGPVTVNAVVNLTPEQAYRALLNMKPKPIAAAPAEPELDDGSELAQ